MDPLSIKPRLQITLTGGIGSGKSMVAARLRELGAYVVEADAIGREVLVPGTPAFNAVARRWPRIVSDARIDRAGLAAIVFDDVDQLHELEGITHPAIARKVAERVAASDADVVVVEHSVDSAFLDGDWVRVVMAAPLEMRIRRAIGRGDDEADVRRRAAVQLDDEEWAAAGDFVLVNDGTATELEMAVDELWGKLLDLASGGNERIRPPDLGPG